MSSFQIIIKSPYQKAQRQSTFLYLLNGFTMTGMGAFSYLLGNTGWVKSVFHPSIVPVGWLSIGLIIYGLILLYAVFFRNRQWLQQASSAKWMRLFCIIANLKVSILFLLSNWWLAAAIAALLLGAQVFALILQRKIGQPLSTTFATDQIILPASARRRTLAWTEVNRVLLRHGILTIDCVNNVLYQWPIDQMPAFSADELEAFSIAQIELAKPKRSSDW